MTKSKTNSGPSRIYGATFLIILLICSFLFTGYLAAQEDLNVITPERRNVGWMKYADASNSLYNYLAEEAFRIIESNSLMNSTITTEDGWQKRQSDIIKTMWEIMGPFDEKTPLNARITSTVLKDGYKVENLIYESLPGFYVTASLFIPDNISKPAPAILFCSGHSTGAYRLQSYQLPLLNLVKKGFVVLAIDPVGQGERLQYYDPDAGKSLIGGSTHEHSYPAPQVSLTGRSVARYFAWDGIRGIDYLVSREEVDSERIGVHGLSGGGTQAAYISALDDRVKASAPSGYITSYKRLLESIGVQDGEQNLYHGLLKGIDHFDYIAVRAPKPTLLMATTRDFFSIQGTRETYKELKKVYEIFGMPDNIEITEDDHGHGYTKNIREAMYAFFQKHLSLPGSAAEEEADFITAEELQKTTTGQLLSSTRCETIFSLNYRDVLEMTNELERSRNNLSEHLTKIISSAAHFSGYSEPSLTDEAVFCGRYPRDNSYVLKYFVKGEGDYVIPYLLFLPHRPNNKAILYLHPSGKSFAATENGEIERLADLGYTVLAPDLPGIGELGPGIFTGDAYIQNVSYNIWFAAMLTGRSITGIHASDINKLANIISSEHGISEIYGIAHKELSPSLLHAAAFNPGISRLAFVEPYSSYSSLATNEFYNPEFVHSLVPGALLGYDLPDLMACVAPRNLLMIDITDEKGIAMNEMSIDRELHIVKRSYRDNNAPGKFMIRSGGLPEARFDFLIEWLK
jgi:dienelactone hydrolase